MRKRVALTFFILVVIAGFINNYAYKGVVDAFQIIGSKKITEAAAPELLNTKQNFNFNLVNVSSKTVKLQDIQLEDYQGITFGSFTVDGKPFQAQDVQGNNHSSWLTSEQGIQIDYDVQISEPAIRNPKKVIVKYSYFGITHTQVLTMP